MSIIRAMQEHDVEAVFQLGAECLPQEAWSKQSLLSELAQKHAITLVAMGDECIVGFLNAHYVLDEANLNTIAVLPAYRRMGVGQQLLQELITKLLSQGKFAQLFLEVRKSNETAIAFYQKHGFIPVGDRKNFYHDPVENALLLIKKFEYNQDEEGIRR